MSLLFRESETICAPITAPATAGVGVIRVSGPRAIASVRSLCTFLPVDWQSHHVYYGWLKRPDTEELIDEVLLSLFAEGKSFTGEETVEISCHGNPQLIRKVLDLLQAQGCLPAERGEFSFRAFRNGRIDLAQAESILSLIEAQSDSAIRLSLRQLRGELSQKISELDEILIWILANIEAGIDFISEDIEVLDYKKIAERINLLVQKIKILTGSYKKARPLVEGLYVTLAGAPNAGKSSLFNALIGQERAIVTPIAGTTRDAIEGRIRLDSGDVLLTDTAGLRETEETIEAIGISITRQSIKRADLIFYLIDGRAGLLDSDIHYLKEINPDQLAVVLSKSDIASERALQDVKGSLHAKGIQPAHGIIQVSAMSRAGFAELTKIFKCILESCFVEDNVIVIQARHYELLIKSQESLLRAQSLICEGASLEFVALELRESLLSVYEILGKRFDDQIMDRVFSEFCIGK